MQRDPKIPAESGTILHPYLHLLSSWTGCIACNCWHDACAWHDAWRYVCVPQCTGSVLCWSNDGTAPHSYAPRCTPLSNSWSSCECFDYAIRMLFCVLKISLGFTVPCNPFQILLMLVELSLLHLAGAFCLLQFILIFSKLDIILWESHFMYRWQQFCVIRQADLVTGWAVQPTHATIVLRNLTGSVLCGRDTPRRRIPTRQPSECQQPRSSFHSCFELVVPGASQQQDFSSDFPCSSCQPCRSALLLQSSLWTFHLAIVQLT